MKLRSILLEAIFRKLRDQFNGLISTMRKAGIEVDPAYLDLRISETTNNINYQVWIMSRLKSLALKPESSIELNNVLDIINKGRLKKAIDNFESKKVGIVKNKITDYNISEFIETFESQFSYDKLFESCPPIRCRVRDPLSLPGVTLVQESGPFKIYEIRRAASLAKMGMGTSWCTRKGYEPCQAAPILRKHGPQRIIMYLDDLLVQYSADFNEFKNTKNHEADPEDFKAFGLKILPNTAKAAYTYLTEYEPKDRNDVIEILKTDPELYLEYQVDNTTEILPEYEASVLKLTGRAYQELDPILHYRNTRYPKGWPAFEDKLLNALLRAKSYNSEKLTDWSCLASEIFLKSDKKVKQERFNKFEEVLSRNPAAFDIDVLYDFLLRHPRRMSKLEETFKKNPTGLKRQIDAYAKFLRYHANIVWSLEEGEADYIEYVKNYLNFRLENPKADPGKKYDHIYNAIIWLVNGKDTVPAEIKELLEQNPRLFKYLIELILDRTKDLSPWPNLEKDILELASQGVWNGLILLYFVYFKKKQWPELIKAYTDGNEIGILKQLENARG